MKKSILAALMVCSITLTSVALPLAASADEYDQKIEEQNNKINDLKNKEAQASAKLTAIESEMISTATKIDELSAKKAKLKDEITKLYEEISDLNVRIQKREVQMRNQARDVQVKGSKNSYFDVILNAESISDAIGRVQGVTTLVSANNDLLKQQKADKKAVESKKKKVEEQVAVLEKATNELNTKKAALTTLKIKQQVAKSDLEAQRATEEKKKKTYIAEKAAAEKRLKEEQERQAKALAAQQKAEAQEAQRLQAAAKANAALIQQTANTAATQTNTSETPAGNSSSIGKGGVSAKKKKAAEIALSAVGQSNPTGWGQSGECIVAVQNWLNAAGINFSAGGPHSGYTQSGAVEVSWSTVQVGDVVQYENTLSPDSWLDGVHTVLVVGVKGSQVQIVESNNPAGSGYVSTTTGWTPSPYMANFRAVVWRFPG